MRTVTDRVAARRHELDAVRQAVEAAEHDLREAKSALAAAGHFVSPEVRARYLAARARLKGSLELAEAALLSP